MLRRVLVRERDARIERLGDEDGTLPRKRRATDVGAWLLRKLSREGVDDGVRHAYGRRHRDDGGERIVLGLSQHLARDERRIHRLVAQH